MACPQATPATRSREIEHLSLCSVWEQYYAHNVRCQQATTLESLARMRDTTYNTLNEPVAQFERHAAPRGTQVGVTVGWCYYPTY